MENYNYPRNIRFLFPLLFSSVLLLFLVGCATTASTQSMQPLAYRGLANGAEMGKITPSSRQIPEKIAHEPVRVQLPIPAASLGGNVHGKAEAIQLGSQTPCGMVVNIRGPLAKVQQGYTAHWVLIRKLDNARDCK